MSLAADISKDDPIWEYSNPRRVSRKMERYSDGKVEVYRSTRKDKKYMIYHPDTNKKVHFGQMGYEDYTKHKDKSRRERYLARATNIRGNWENDAYSPNNLSIHILW